MTQPQYTQGYPSGIYPNDQGHPPVQFVGVSAPFTNGWVNRGLPYGPAGFYSMNGRTYLCGAIKTGLSGTSAFTLPVSFRSLFLIESPALASGGIAEIVIDPTGTIVPANIGATNVSAVVLLDGISFLNKL